MLVQALGGALLVLVGLLLGTTWTIRTLQPRLRRQAAERRRLNDEWLAVSSARHLRGECPRCAAPLSEANWNYHRELMFEDSPDDTDENALDNIQARVLHAMRLGVEYDLQQVCSASRVSLTQALSALKKLQDLNFVDADTDARGTVRYKKLVSGNPIGVFN